MSNKNLLIENYKNRVLSSSSNIKTTYKIKKSQSRQKFGRTSSAINLPRVRYNHETNETMSFNSTGFSFHPHRFFLSPHSPLCCELQQRALPSSLIGKRQGASLNS